MNTSTRIIVVTVALFFVVGCIVPADAAEKEKPAKATKKAAPKKTAKKIDLATMRCDGPEAPKALQAASAATPGKWEGKIPDTNPIVKGRRARGLQVFVPPCDVPGKPGLKGVPLKGGACGEIKWTKYKDPDTGVVRIVQGLPTKTVTIDGVPRELPYKIGSTLPQDWIKCPGPEVFVDGTKYQADGHVNCCH